VAAWIAENGPFSKPYCHQLSSDSLITRTLFQFGRGTHLNPRLCAYLGSLLGYSGILKHDILEKQKREHEPASTTKSRMSARQREWCAKSSIRQ